MAHRGCRHQQALMRCQAGGRSQITAEHNGARKARMEGHTHRWLRKSMTRAGCSCWLMAVKPCGCVEMIGVCV